MALGFAMAGANPKKDRHPVLYKIYFCKNSSYFYMGDPRFSAYHGEKEILLRNGMRYKILSIQKSFNNVTVIELLNHY